MNIDNVIFLILSKNAYTKFSAVPKNMNIVWQQVIKHLPLTVAFCNKSVSTIWSMICGVLFFQEVITINMLIGAGIVLLGVILVVTSNE